MTAKEKHELIERLSALPAPEQLEVIEALIRGLRKASQDYDAIAKAMDAMVADPGMQRVLRNEDLVKSDTEG